MNKNNILSILLFVQFYCFMIYIYIYTHIPPGRALGRFIFSLSGLKRIMFRNTCWV